MKGRRAVFSSWRRALSSNGTPRTHALIGALFWPVSNRRYVFSSVMSPVLRYLAKDVRPPGRDPTHDDHPYDKHRERTAEVRNRVRYTILPRDRHRLVHQLVINRQLPESEVTTIDDDRPHLQLDILKVHLAVANLKRRSFGEQRRPACIAGAGARDVKRLTIRVQMIESNGLDLPHVVRHGSSLIHNRRDNHWNRDFVCSS